MKDPIIDLQTRLAFQEQTISELNQVLTDQQQQIDKLNLHISLLQDEINALTELSEKQYVDSGQEKPPHY